MTKDEEGNIAKCLTCLRDFDEVFVVDSNSTDATAKIAAEQGAQVVPFSWNKRYPKKKQWSLDNLPFSHRWVLFVDADEEVTPESAAEIRAVTTGDSPHAAYSASFDYWFLGKRLRHGQRMSKLVMFQRDRGHFREQDDLGAENMWEVEGHYQPVIDGSIGTLRRPMIHRDHSSLYDYLARHNRYSDWEALVRRTGALEEDQARLPLAIRVLQRVFNLLPFKGGLAFLRSFVFERGFLDGRAGFHFAVAKGFYYWQIGLKGDELSRVGAPRAEDRS